MCLYYTFVFLNFLVFLQALAMMGIAIYIFIFTEAASAFNIGFFIISIVLMGTSLFAFKLRQRLELLAAYLGLLLLVFLAELILTIMLMVNKENMLDSLRTYFEANDPNSAASIEELNNKIDRNYDGIIMALWIFTGVTVNKFIKEISSLNYFVLVRNNDCWIFV